MQSNLAKHINIMRKLLFLLGPPAVSITMLLMPEPNWLTPKAWHFLSLLLWILFWWMTETVNIAITSLLPLILFPLAGIMNEEIVASHYAKPVIFLFMGGFFLGESLRKWSLHKRFAYFVLHIFGKNPHGILAGFILSTACISMWISNTATSIMMAAIGISVVETLEKTSSISPQATKNFAKALFLSIAYGASIGGIATLIGTPPNLFYANFMADTMNKDISMLRWSIKALPFVVSMLILSWLLFVFIFPEIRRISLAQIRTMLQEERKKFTPLGKPERVIILVFSLTAVLWILRVPLARLTGLPLSDSIIAIGASLVLFSIPISLDKNEFSLDWQTARNIPWGILLMFGAGLSLATGFKTTGIDDLIAKHTSVLSHLPNTAMLLLFITFAIFLTELISNTAAVAILLPIILTVSNTLDIPFSYLAIPATISCSAAFMLPVATPPNAVAFSTGYLSIKEMTKIGLLLNIAGIGILALLGMVGWF